MLDAIFFWLTRQCLKHIWAASEPIYTMLNGYADLAITGKVTDLSRSETDEKRKSGRRKPFIFASLRLIHYSQNCFNHEHRSHVHIISTKWRLSNTQATAVNHQSFRPHMCAQQTKQHPATLCRNNEDFKVVHCNMGFDKLFWRGQAKRRLVSCFKERMG